LVVKQYPDPELRNTRSINRDSRIAGNLTAAAGELASCKNKLHGRRRINPCACRVLHHDMPARHSSGFNNGFSRTRTQRDVRMHSAA